jgi:hypothetical protein
MKQKEDWSTLTFKQRIGYRLVRALGTLQAWVQARLIGEPVWRAATGKCTPISRMSDGHLYNALRMLQRTGDQPELEEMCRREYHKRETIRTTCKRILRGNAQC